MKKHLFLFVLFAFILSMQINTCHGKEKVGKPAPVKAGSTITIDRNQFMKMMEKLDSLQKQVDTLKTELNEVKSTGSKGASSPESAVKADDKPLSDEEILLQLQKEMQGGDKPAGEVTPAVAPASDQNPKISIIGDFVWKVNHNKKVDGGNPFSLREVELTFQDQVDPWTRADISLGIHDGHLHVEEGYLSFHKLPGGAQGRIGKFLLPFGKDNQTHQHAKPYVDMPLCVNNFMGPENLAGTGAQVSYMIPLGTTHTEITGAVVNDESSRVFSSGTSGKPLYLAGFRAYKDLSESSNLEVGYSRLQGFNNEAADRLSRLNGVDLTYRWKPLKSGLYNSFMARGEYMWNKMSTKDRTINSRGYYGFAQYQLNRNWYLGGRYDYSEFPGLTGSAQRATSGIITYFPTEFAYYRLQYKNTTRDYAKDLKELMFQINFMMGPHGAHKF